MVLEQNFQHVDQLSLFDKAVPTQHLQSVSLSSSAKEYEGRLDEDEGELEEDEGESEENEVVLEDC